MPAEDGVVGGAGYDDNIQEVMLTTGPDQDDQD
jgi:hypothetical protein